MLVLMDCTFVNLYYALVFHFILYRHSRALDKLFGFAQVLGPPQFGPGEPPGEDLGTRPSGRYCGYLLLFNW